MGTAEPLLTVVLSSFNLGQYVAQAMEALVPQLGPDVALLVIDDASTDNSLELLQAYAADNDQVTVVRNTVNTGIHAVLNQGLALVRSPWILYSAMDDRVYSDLVPTMLPLLRRFPDAGLCTAPVDYLGADGEYRCPWMGPSLPDQVYCTPEKVAGFARSYGFWFAGMTTVLSVAALRAAGGFQASLGHLADSFVSQELALRHGMVTVSRALAGVRQLPGSYSASRAGDLALAEELRHNAVERMRNLPNVFPGAFQRDWEAFSRVWDCLRAWKHGPHQAWSVWLREALEAENGHGLLSRSVLRLTYCCQALHVLILGLFATARLWKNPLFRVRVVRYIRAKFL